MRYEEKLMPESRPVNMSVLANLDEKIKLFSDE